MTSRSKKRNRREPLNPERVVQAAVALADAKGIEALSMRKLGQSLGVEAMSLYKHVANKEEVIDGMVELVASEFQPPRAPFTPEDGALDWRQAMRARARTTHEVLMRHPWATMMLMSRVNVGPAMLGYLDATIGCLVGAGFSYAEADHAWNAMDNHIYGFTLQKLNFPFEPGEYADAAKAHIELIPVEQFPHMYGMAQEVIAGRHDGISEFDYGLDLILDGLARRLAGAA